VREGDRNEAFDRNGLMAAHAACVGACFELRNCFVQVFELFFCARDQTRVGLDIGARSRHIDVVAGAQPVVSSTSFAAHNCRGAENQF
jgi:hypothetical protein